MTNPTAVLPTLTIGIDLGDRYAHVCTIDRGAKLTHEPRVSMTPGAFRKYFRRLRAKWSEKLREDDLCRVVFETGTHSAWVDEVLAELGFETVIANPRIMMQPGGGRRRRKNDKIDAAMLARMGRADPELLAPMKHRGAEVRVDLTLIRVRSVAVNSRTMLINSVRGLVKPHGFRLLGCSTAAFHKRVPEQISHEGLRRALLPVVDLIEQLTETIKAYDLEIDRLAKTKYRESQCLTQVTGVANLTALTYLLTIERHERFRRSRSVGPYLGLVPRQFQSGNDNPELRITKTGDPLVRRLLVQAAHYILGPLNTVDSDLRRFGLSMAEGSKSARKKAVVAVARRLAVLLHALWRSGEVYDPLRQANARLARAS